MQKFPRKILIVDDEVLIIRKLTDAITLAGYITFSAKNGKEALLIAKKRNPDLIVIDMLMPIKDGITMLKNLRRTSWGKDIAVILLSNLQPSDSLMRDFVLQNLVYIVTKSPLQIQEVTLQIKKILPQQ